MRGGVRDLTGRGVAGGEGFTGVHQGYGAREAVSPGGVVAPDEARHDGGGESRDLGAGRQPVRRDGIVAREVVTVATMDMRVGDGGPYTHGASGSGPFRKEWRDLH